MYIGMGTAQGRTETADGIDAKLALHYYSRVALIQKLVDIMPEGSRVMTVLSGGVHKPYVNDDMELKNNYTLGNAANAAGFYNDLAMAKLAQLHPKLSFIHAAPGAVNTNWGSEMPWYLKGPIRTFQVFFRSIGDCGEYMSYGLLAPQYAAGLHIMTPDADAAKTTNQHTEENINKVWQHTLSVLDRVNKQ